METLTQDDRDHLRALSIAHYVYGVLMILFCVFFVSIFLGAMFFARSAPQQPGNQPPPFFFGIMAIVAIVIFSMYAGWAIVTWLAGRYLQQRRRWLYCVVIAGLDCAWFPLGTALGVLTLIVLLRPSVKGAFDSPSPPPVMLPTSAPDTMGA